MSYRLMAVRVRCPYPGKTGVPKVRVELRSKLLSDYRRSLLAPTRSIALEQPAGVGAAA